MRFVILTDDHPPRVGGVSAFVHRVGRELVVRGHEVRVFARYRRDLREVPGTKLTGVWGRSFGTWSGRWLGLRAAPALLQADRILATTWLCGTVAARLGRPLQVVAHGSDVTRPPRRPRAFRRVWAAAHQRFALSRFLADALLARGVQARVLPAPVRIAPAPVALSIGGDRPRWGFVARAVPSKGGDRFVRLVAEAGAEGVVVGDGPALPRWRALATTLGARITFAGQLPPERVRALLLTLDLVCLLPRAYPDGTGAEGLGLTLIEAAALGVPTVGVNIGGVPEAVGPGLILDAPDDPATSARAIEQWWDPLRGQEAWAWCSASHGTGRVVDALTH